MPIRTTRRKNARTIPAGVAMKTPAKTPSIIIDTREQDPFDFSEFGATATRGKLHAGDYSITGAENTIMVERKTIADLVHTVIHDRSRFSFELHQAARIRCAIIVVEGSMENIMAHEYESDASPRSILAACNAIQSVFHIPVNFCSTRQIACLWTYDFLCRWHKKLFAD